MQAIVKQESVLRCGRLAANRETMASYQGKMATGDKRCRRVAKEATELH